MVTTILDCYTDEPSGLGVPPYLGTYPRYLYGYLDGKAEYLTIDDLRYHAMLQNVALPDTDIRKHNRKLNRLDLQSKNKELKTDIRIKNLTKQPNEIQGIIQKTDELIVVGGVHTPGTYLSALPGTLFEINTLSRLFDAEKILTGPAVYGTRLEGGKSFEAMPLEGFRLKHFTFPYSELDELFIKGASIVHHIPDLRIVELETSRGCTRWKGCTFCTEPIKNRYEHRGKESIINEAKELYRNGVRYFRLGKQSSLYSHPGIIEILRTIRKECPNLEVLHIDNVDPLHVLSRRGEEITKAVATYCTSGNIAAFGVESFDKTVIKENNLIVPPEAILKAVRIINKWGAHRGPSGLPTYLPGINLLFGLKGETKSTHEENMKFLKQILAENLMFRRLNIRQVALFEGTPLYQDPDARKSLRKNKKHYWKWRNQIRNEVDAPMLNQVVPKGTVLRKVRMEVYDGNTTFGRQIGTYPLVVGVPQRLQLGSFYDISITDHMLRSVVGKVHGAL